MAFVEPGGGADRRPDRVERLVDLGERGVDGLSVVTRFPALSRINYDGSQSPFPSVSICLLARHVHENQMPVLCHHLERA